MINILFPAKKIIISNKFILSLLLEGNTLNWMFRKFRLNTFEKISGSDNQFPGIPCILVMTERRAQISSLPPVSNFHHPIMWFSFHLILCIVIFSALLDHLTYIGCWGSIKVTAQVKVSVIGVLLCVCFGFRSWKSWIKEAAPKLCEESKKKWTHSGDKIRTRRIINFGTFRNSFGTDRKEVVENRVLLIYRKRRVICYAFG